MIQRWARSHPWAAAYVVAFVPIALFTIVAAIADWSDSAVVLVALCSVTIAAFVFDELKNGRRSKRAEGDPPGRVQRNP